MPDDNVVRCPFNVNHAISRARFQRHLVKCEKNYPPGYKVICPYDATHRISKNNVVEHINTCPMRKILEASFIQSLNHDAMTLMKYNSENETDYYKNKVEIEMTKSHVNPFRHSEQINQTKQSIMGNPESQVNAMSIGRGRIRSNNQYFNTKSIYTENNAESIVDTIAIGRGRIMINSIEYYHRFRGRKN